MGKNVKVYGPGEVSCKEFARMHGVTAMAVVKRLMTANGGDIFWYANEKNTRIIIPLEKNQHISFDKEKWDRVRRK